MFLLVLVFSLSFSLSDSPCHACCFLMQFALHIYLFSYCADYHSADLIINSSSPPPPFPSCHCFPLNLIFLLVYLLPSSHLFSFAPRLALRSPPLIWAPAVSHLSLWFTSSLFHFHLSLLPPPPVSFPLGRRRNLGDQRREHQGHEARASHRAHQEWRPASPSGAQEGWRLCAWIWWVNLRKHSLLAHLHTLSQGTLKRLVVGWRWRN